jgi:hypothetical protein
MRKLIPLVLVVFAAAIPAKAQDYPSSEIFGGYSYLSEDTGSGFRDREGVHGVGGGFTVNLGPTWGLATDLSYHRKTFDDVDNFKIQTTHFLFGPQFSARSSAGTAFGHVLVGGVNRKFSSDSFGSVSGTDFALGLGGGFDVNVGRSFAVRIVQADYLPSRGGGVWNHNFRIQAGVVIKLGT